MKCSMSKGLLMTALITGSVMWGGTSVFAEELQEFSLDQMVVTATRTETRDLETPATVSVITSKEIENSGAKTAYEIIERQVGFTNNAYGPGGREFGGSSTRTVLRGLDKGTLVMVNGAPINMMNYNSMEGIPVEAIEKIEIVRGAQSVLYGAEATGGVVNIITKKNGNRTTISVGAGNYDRKWGLFSSGKGYTVAVSKDYLGDVDQTNKVFEKSTRKWKYRDSSKDNAFVSLSPTDKLSFNFAHTEGNYYRDSYTVTNGVETGAGIAYYYKDRRDNLSAIYDDKDNQFKTIVSYNKRVVSPYQATLKGFVYGPNKRGTSSDWNLNTLTWDTQKAWNFRDDKDTLVLGMTISKEEAEDRTEHMQGDRKNYGLYASYKYALSDRFDVTAGIRGQHISEDYLKGKDKTKDHNEFVPQIQALYKINDTTSWYANAAKSYQLPPLNQFFKYTGRGVDDLKPQEGWTYETGIKHITDTASVKAGVYHMDIDAKFDWVDIGLPDKVLKNVGKFKNDGLEIEYKKHLSDQLSYNLGAAFSNPKTKEEGKNSYKQSDAKLQLTAGIDYTVGKLSSNLNFLYLGKRENSYYNSLGVKGSDHSIPHRSLLNANFTYKADEHHSASLTLNNLLDRDDTINKYENWGMPFNWMLTYNYTF